MGRSDARRAACIIVFRRNSPRRPTISWTATPSARCSDGRASPTSIASTGGRRCCRGWSRSWKRFIDNQLLALEPSLSESIAADVQRCRRIGGPGDDVEEFLEGLLEIGRRRHRRGAWMGMVDAGDLEGAGPTPRQLAAPFDNREVIDG